MPAHPTNPPTHRLAAWLLVCTAVLSLAWAAADAPRSEARLCYDVKLPLVPIQPPSNLFTSTSEMPAH
jgi:hypothetical protein